MWIDHALEAMETIGEAASEQDVFSALSAFAFAMDADLLSYHYHSPPALRPMGEDDATIEVFAAGFPDDWVARYVGERLHRVDPITALAATRTRPFLWSDIRSLAKLTDDQSNYLGELHAWLGEGEDGGDGMAIPAFGPSGQHGYFGVGSRAGLCDWEPIQVRVLQGVCGSMHLRFCELRLAVPRTIAAFEPTEREVEILRLVSQGHPDWLVGGLVGMNTNSVRDRVRSLMSALSVTDRPSLLLRARALGVLS